jgi:hypothetical protein
MTYYLYKKTHRKTGLQYLGKTKQDPYEYKGSGKHWSAHVNKHGNDVTTEVLLETEDHNEITKMGLYYSELWNVVESKEWANLKVEQGDGGWDHMNSKLTSEDYRQRGKVGRKAQDEYYIKHYGSIHAGRMATINPKKVSESLKKKYQTDSKFRERTQQTIRLAGEAALLPESRAKRKETFKKIGHSQGAKNSQYGTCWITKDGSNKKIKANELDKYLQEGYVKGRVVN